MESANQSSGSFLTGVRVLELADELGEYCGKVLAGLGADVIKVEPPGGEATRLYAPFYHDDPHPNRSLYFWHYNFGKRSICLDLDAEEDKSAFHQLASNADVVIDSRHRNYLRDRGIGHDQLVPGNPGLVYARISPFGDDGPWADYQSSDLIHLALGGVMMNCGYDPMPNGEYDTPPIAPQMWQSYQIAGEVTAIQIIAALCYKGETGRGQLLQTSVHDAVSKTTETDIPDWVYARRPHHRLTCRHSFPQLSETKGDPIVVTPRISATKDGRWILPYRTYLPGFPSPVEGLVQILKKYGLEDDLEDAKYDDVSYLQRPDVSRHIDSVIDRLLVSFKYDRDIWKEGQEVGFAWAPIRRPEENAEEAHWSQRETFFEVAYPELGETFTQVGGKWVSPDLPWRRGPRAPMVGEHSSEVLKELSGTAATRTVPVNDATGGSCETRSKRGKPFALSGVRVIDLSWLLASAGAGRFFTALGAEVIKVEHKSKLDMMRLGTGGVPDGGRAERDAATSPLSGTPSDSPNRSGNFMEINSGKMALSLNLKTTRGKEILRSLLRDADIVIEGFSPGTMDRMGLSYEQLREINPKLVYVQQSGMGQHGTYGRLRSFGPTAQAFSGISDMSGLSDPYPPAGIGYSYLDWFGAYQMAVAMMAGLFRQRATGRGCWIDSSQVESGIYLTGTSVLDHSVNGRRWARIGNSSPYKLAAPHGAYPGSGEDRWIAIAAFTEAHWAAIIRILRRPEWSSDPKLVTLQLRVKNSDYLDSLVANVTQNWDVFELMEILQMAGVPAGVCATAEDRCDWDPQLKHLEWQVELEQDEIGRWPVKEVPVVFSETPPYIGGKLDRHGPSYGQDNDYILGEVLGFSRSEIEELARNDII